MLLRRELPSWLYQVRMGATTVWERWDAIRPDGSIHPGTMTPPAGWPSGRKADMLSFNHYAYGAVVDWVYRHVAGLAPDRRGPGYRHVIVAPRPVEGIDHASAALESPYGRVAVSWQVDGAGSLVLDVELPDRDARTVHPPAAPRSRVTVEGVARDGLVALGPGRRAIDDHGARHRRTPGRSPPAEAPGSETGRRPVGSPPRDSRSGVRAGCRVGRRPPPRNWSGRSMGRAARPTPSVAPHPSCHSRRRRADVAAQQDSRSTWTADALGCVGRKLHPG